MNKVVLYLENDETEKQRFVSHFVGYSSFTCITANSLSETSDIIKREQVDVIVANSRLNDGESVELLNLYSDIPIIILGSGNDVEQGIRVLRLGAHDFMIKDDAFSYLKLLPIACEQAISRKEKELELYIFTQIVQQNPCLIVVTDNKGLIEYVNPIAIDFTGYTSSEMIGVNPKILKSGVHDPAFYKEMWKQISSGQVWRGEICNKAKDKELFWEIASIAPIKNKAGKITHYIKVSEVITEKKKEEQERLDSERSTAVMQMAGAISHEINQPLQIILGYTELLKERLKDDTSASKQFSHIITNINRIMEISKKLKGITDYRTKQYLDGIIVDIHQEVESD